MGTVQNFEFMSDKLTHTECVLPISPHLFRGRNGLEPSQGHRAPLLARMAPVIAKRKLKLSNLNFVRIFLVLANIGI